MAGTGIGLPNADHFSTYGGALANYPIGVTDPTKEEDAALRNIYVANIAGMTRTIDRAVRSFMVPTSGQAVGAFVDGTGIAHDAVWGSDSSVKPGGTYISAGTIDIIWPTTVTDALGQVQQIAIKRARAVVNANTPATYYHAIAVVTANNKVRVYTFDNAANTPTDISGVGVGASVTLWVR